MLFRVDVDVIAYAVKEHAEDNAHLLLECHAVPVRLHLALSFNDVGYRSMRWHVVARGR